MLLLCACGRGHDAGLSLRVEITHVVGTEPLRLDGTAYRSAAGDEFTVTRLRYYLSNVRLHRADGSWFTAPRDDRSSQGYYLIDESDAASKTFDIAPVPAGDYDGIEFLVGVDAARNTAGVQSGTLDPARGLFWTWKSGYIFFLFEGRSPQAPAADHALEFHIGGAGAPVLSRTVYLPLAPDAAHVDARLRPLVHLHADIGALFTGAHEIRFADTAHVHLQSGVVPPHIASRCDNPASVSGECFF